MYAYVYSENVLQLGTQSEKFTLVYKYDKGYNIV